MFKRSVGALLIAAGGLVGSGVAAHAQDARDAEEFWAFTSFATMGTDALACASACCCSRTRIARSPGVDCTRNGSGGIAEV